MAPRSTTIATARSSVTPTRNCSNSPTRWPAARDGLETSRWVMLKMGGDLDDKASVRAFGIDVLAQLCQRLIDGGAPSIHFYALNQSALTPEICKRST